jgi:hypothetical protein
MHEVMNREIVGFFNRKLPSGQTRQTTVRRRRRHMAHAIPKVVRIGEEDAWIPAAVAPNFALHRTGVRGARPGR